MDWWQKMRRVWISVSARIKHSRKHVETNGGRDGGHSSNGLLNLRDDVQTCGYKDVQVMWNMLYKSPKEEQMAVEVVTVAAGTSARPSIPKCSKQRFNWRFLFWTYHRNGSSSSLSSLLAKTNRDHKLRRQRQ